MLQDIIYSFPGCMLMLGTETSGVMCFTPICALEAGELTSKHGDVLLEAPAKWRPQDSDAIKEWLQSGRENDVRFVDRMQNIICEIPSILTSLETTDQKGSGRVCLRLARMPALNNRNSPA